MIKLDKFYLKTFLFLLIIILQIAVNLYYLTLTFCDFFILILLIVIFDEYTKYTLYMR